MQLTPSAIERRKTYIEAFVARAAKEAESLAQNERVEEAYAVLDSGSSLSQTFVISAKRADDVDLPIRIRIYTLV